MKYLKNKLPLLVAVCVAALFAACYEASSGLDSGTDYTLTTQAEVENFSPDGEIRDLIIEGEAVTDLRNLKVRNAKRLIIRHTGIETLDMPHLSAVVISFEVTGNSRMTAMSDLDNLKFIGGDVVIEDNPLLEDVSGLMNLKIFAGHLIVRNNASLGEDKAGQPVSYGFNVIKYLISSSVLVSANVSLSNNHPLAATDPVYIGQMGQGGVLSYEIHSDKDADLFSPAGDEAWDLLIEGRAVTNVGLRLVAGKLKSVKHCVTLENTSVSNTEGFFDVVACEGSIVLRDNDGGTGGYLNINGFKGYTRIGGDLIVENCVVYHWPKGNTFTGIRTIEGSLRMIGTQMTNTSFASIERIGGDLELRNIPATYQNTYLWNLNDLPLTRIGGSVIFSGNDWLNGLGGLEKLTELGGDVLIEKCGGKGGEIPMKSAGSRMGWCVLRDLLDAGVIRPDATITIRDSQGVDIDFDTVPSSQLKGQPRDMTFASRAELQAYVNETTEEQAEKDVARNLTISGADITEADLSYLPRRLAGVTETLTIDGVVALTSLGAVMDNLTCSGGFVFRNLPNLKSIKAFTSYKEIKGDLIFIDCPKMETANGGDGYDLNNLTRVAGTLRFERVGNTDNATRINSRTIAKLEEVGGDFVFSECQANFWNFSPKIALRSVGGDFVITGNRTLNGLGGMKSLASIGGNVTVSGNIPLQNVVNASGAVAQLGLGWIKHLKDTGVLKAASPVITLIGPDGRQVDVDSLTPATE